jgi:16S rRNA U516 pseudouridylate synthase RsuA-like enzyme
MKKWVEATEQWYSPDEDPDSPTELLSCVTVSYRKTSKEKHEVIITLNEWKKRQLRRIMRVLWYRIYSLHRLKVGKWHIWDLKTGKWRIEKIKRAPKGKKKK